jgi:hypothetical protein
VIGISEMKKLKFLTIGTIIDEDIVDGLFYIKDMIEKAPNRFTRIYNIRECLNRAGYNNTALWVGSNEDLFWAFMFYRTEVSDYVVGE